MPAKKTTTKTTKTTTKKPAAKKTVAKTTKATTKKPAAKKTVAKTTKATAKKPAAKKAPTPVIAEVKVVKGKTSRTPKRIDPGHATAIGVAAGVASHLAGWL